MNQARLKIATRKEKEKRMTPSWRVAISKRARVIRSQYYPLGKWGTDYS